MGETLGVWVVGLCSVPCTHVGICVHPVLVWGPAGTTHDMQAKRVMPLMRDVSPLLSSTSAARPGHVRVMIHSIHGDVPWLHMSPSVCHVDVMSIHM